MGGLEYQQIVLWRASDQSLRDQSFQRNAFTLGTGATLDATGGKFGGGCYHSNGASTAFASAPHDNKQRFAASGDFYCSAWVKLEGTGTQSQQVIMGKAGAGAQQFYFAFNQAHTQLAFFHTTDGNSGTTASVGGAVSITEGQWYHVAASRSGGTVRVFLDGTVIASGTLTGTYALSSVNFTVGGIVVTGSNYPLKGSINDAQLVVGNAVHTASFTPETDYIVPYDITIVYRKSKCRVNPGTARPYPAAARAAGVMRGTKNTRDIYHYGAYKITGTVKQYDTPVNTPLHRKVVLLREPDQKVLGVTWSDADTGVYLFPNITNAYKYTVIAFDYANNYRAVVGDRQTAEPM